MISKPKRWALAPWRACPNRDWSRRVSKENGRTECIGARPGRAGLRRDRFSRNCQMVRPGAATRLHHHPPTALQAVVCVRAGAIPRGGLPASSAGALRISAPRGISTGGGASSQVSRITSQATPRHWLTTNVTEHHSPELHPHRCSRRQCDAEEHTRLPSSVRQGG